MSGDKIVIQTRFGPYALCRDNGHIIVYRGESRRNEIGLYVGAIDVLPSGRISCDGNGEYLIDSARVEQRVREALRHSLKPLKHLVVEQDGQLRILPTTTSAQKSETKVLECRVAER
jgi:hypothetical protein